MYTVYIKARGTEVAAVASATNQGMMILVVEAASNSVLMLWSMYVGVGGTRSSCITCVIASGE